MPKLTPKQEMFVKEYLVDLNATKASIRAGYSEDTARQIGSDNLSKAYIQDAIQVEMDKRSQRVNLTADDILRDIIEVKDRCMANVEPIYEGYGENREFTGEYKFEHNGALKALELLGKHKKLFTDKVEIEVTRMPAIEIVKKKL